MQMRIKIYYGHQTNIPLTILPFDHPHNHGKHLYAPHSDCHQSSHWAGDLSSFIMVNILIMSIQVDENQTPVSVIANTILSRRYFLCDQCVTSPKEPRSQHIGEGRQLCSTKEFETWGASDWQAPEYISGDLMLLYVYIHLLRYF